MAMRYGWLGLDYLAAICYRLGLFTLFKCLGVYLGGTQNGLCAEKGKQVLSHELRSHQCSLYLFSHLVLSPG